MIYDDDANAATFAAEKRDSEELRAAFAAVLSTAEGKRVMFWVLEQAAIYRDAYSGEDGATNYLLGQQAVGRKLIGLMDDIDPRTYPKLLLDIADMRMMDRAAARAEATEDDEDA